MFINIQSPPASAKVPKSVSDRKRFFENAMEDQQKPTPKSGKVLSNEKCCVSLQYIIPFNKMKQKLIATFIYVFFYSIEKVFTFLSKDEVENLKQEEEKKIATLQRNDKRKALVNEYEEDDDDEDNDSRHRRIAKEDDELQDNR